MYESFSITFSQCFVLFSFIAIGYWAVKSGRVSDNYSKGLSNLLVYIFAPFLTFGTMADNFRLDILADKVPTIGASFCLLSVLMMMAFLFAKVFSTNSNEHDIYLYSFMFPNSGYIGYPLVLSIFGEQMLFEFMIFCIPFLILTYTFGVYTLNPNKEFSLKKLFNPIMISMVLGMIAGIFEIKLPAAIETVIDTGGNCMAPAAMILTGMVFAANDMKTLLNKPKVYLACIIKLIVIPVAGILLLSLLNISKEIAFLITVMLTLPTGLNSIIFPEAYGGDSRTGAQLCFISTTICMFTIPVMMSVFELISS